MQVDTCKNYQNPKCSKCGRMVPDTCADFEDMQKKAAAYDQLMAGKEDFIGPVQQARKGRRGKANNTAG